MVGRSPQNHWADAHRSPENVWRRASGAIHNGKESEQPPQGSTPGGGCSIETARLFTVRGGRGLRPSDPQFRTVNPIGPIPPAVTEWNHLRQTVGQIEGDNNSIDRFCRSFLHADSTGDRACVPDSTNSGFEPARLIR